MIFFNAGDTGTLWKVEKKLAKWYHELIIIYALHGRQQTLRVKESYATLKK